VVAAVIEVAVVALPFATAMLLTIASSWRAGTAINAASAGIQFAVAWVLAWSSRSWPADLALLTAFVAMTTSWFGRRDIAASLAARLISRRRTRRYHVGFQSLIGAVQAATLAENLMLTWLALSVAVAAAAVMVSAARRPAAVQAVSRLVRQCAIGLQLALLGMLLLNVAPDAAGLFLLVGYGALAGLVPLHSWLPAAAEQSVAPAAIILMLLANVPIVLFMRLHLPPGLLMAFGFASFLPAAIALHAKVDRPRTVALAGTAQLGMMAIAIGVGAKPAAWLHLTLLTLARSAVLQSGGGNWFATLTLALLPLYALCLLAASAAAAPWLLLPLAAGALVATWALLEQPAPAASRDWRETMPVWLHLGLIAVLAFAWPPR
jgi:hydrogenase-4 component F